jgi:hypothetical protein
MLNCTSASGTFIQMQSSTVNKAAFGWGNAGIGVGIFDYVNNSYWLQQGGTTKNKIISGNNTLDDGSGNVIINGNSITSLVVNSSSATANSISLQYNSGTQGLYLKYSTAGGIQILDSTAMVWLGQQGATAHAVQTFNNTLDAGSGGCTFGSSGSQGLNLATGSFSGTLSLGNASSTITALGIINLGVTGSAAIGLGSSSFSGTISLGNASSTLNVLGVVNVNTSGSANTNIATGSNSGTLTLGNHTNNAVNVAAPAIIPVTVGTVATGTNLGSAGNPWSGLYLGAAAGAGMGAFQFIELTMNAAAVAAMYATPAAIVTNSAGNSYFVLFALISYSGGSAAFTAGGAITLQYGNTVHGGGSTALNFASIAATFLTSGTTSQNVWATGLAGSATPITTALTDGQGLYMSNQTQAFATGTGGSLNVKVWFVNLATTN